MDNSDVVVRQVWTYNLMEEFDFILRSLWQFPYICIDTEFPGTIFNIYKDALATLTPSRLYSVMKRNVDLLHLVQIGLTLSDAQGRLPQLGTHSRYVWQFNFCEFDSERDLQNPGSVSLLRKQGTDFVKNKCLGVKSCEFAKLFKISPFGRSSLLQQTWITFHGLYDFGFLIKILTGRQLPENLEDFMVLVEVYFGEAVYDLKPMAQALGLHGGLEKVAERLDLRRVVGKGHQAGSDSLLCMLVFMELKKRNWLTPVMMEKFNHQLHGLMSFSPIVYPKYSNKTESPVRVLSHIYTFETKSTTGMTHINTNGAKCSLKPTNIDRKNETDHIRDEAMQKKEDEQETEMKKEE